MNISHCCENCRGSNAKLDNSGTYINYVCVNPVCPCHNPPSQEKQECGYKFPNLNGRCTNPKPCENHWQVRQPSEAWEADFQQFFTVHDGKKRVIHGSYENVEKFIRETVKKAEHSAMLRQRSYDQREIAEAREEERENWQAAEKNTYMEAYGIGKEAALKKCLEVVEGMGKENNTIGYRAALSDLKQQISSLLENK